MNDSVRLGGGLPSQCPLCSAALSRALPTGEVDLACPSCGHLVLFASDTLAVLRRQFANRLGTAASRITATTELDELGFDSVSFLELVLEFEEKFGVRISEDQAAEMATVGDIVRVIEAAHRQKPLRKPPLD